MGSQEPTRPPDAPPERPGAPLSADPEIMRDRTVFAGTRVPVQVLFENLADGLSVDEIVASYPTLRKEDALSVLAEASRRLTRRPFGFGEGGA
jgi:uncharacterized protein (DUF433 family)